jgi:hypothetical protein
MSSRLGKGNRKRAGARSERDSHERDRECRQHERRDIWIHHDGKADSDASGAQPAEHATSVTMRPRNVRSATPPFTPGPVLRS